jgi:hypothetical protein
VLQLWRVAVFVASDFGLPTSSLLSYSLFLIPYSLFLIPYSLFLISFPFLFFSFFSFSWVKPTAMDSATIVARGGFCCFYFITVG